MHFVAGARYACLACATRGIAPQCANCGAADDVVDLSNESGRRRWLLFRAPGSRIGRRHRWFDPRVLPALPPGRQWLWVSPRIAFVIGLVWALTSDAIPPATSFVALFTHLVVAIAIGGLAMLAPIFATAPVVFLAIGVAGLCAQLLTLSGDLAALVARFTNGSAAERASRWRDALRHAAQRNVMQATLDVLERLFMLRLRVAPAPMGPDASDSLLGTVIGERSSLLLVEERTGTFELSDVVESPIELELRDGERVGIVLGAAYVQVVSVVHSRDSIGVEVKKQLEWTDVEGARLDRAVAIRLGSGARVKVRGGVWTERADGAESSAGYRVAASKRVLTGTCEAPLWLEVAV